MADTWLLLTTNKEKSKFEDKRSVNNVKKFITGIDGLRTLGVLAVIFYHIAPTTFAGGYLGVIIFLVISGYFVTDSLLREYGRERKINWKSFAIKRLKRIYPLLIMVFLVAALFFFFFQPKMLIGMRDSFLSSIFSVNNWWQIINGSSYFSNFAQMANNAFKHIYFLSIEGQFYVVLAVLFLILPKKKARGFSFSIIILLSLISAVGMALLFKPNDPTRVYYGTDTRLFALLVGVALAFVFRRHRLQKQDVSTVNRIFSIPLAFVLLSVIVAALFLLPDKSSIVYFGGMYGFSILVALLIALVAHPALPINRYFSNRVFSYIGTRSYGIYLWQLPVFVSLENWGINIAIWYNVVWELLLIVILSEVSYRFVEEPLKHASWRSFKIFFMEKAISIHKIPFYAIVPLGLAALLVILSAPTQARDIIQLQNHIAKAQKNTTNHNLELESEAKSKSLAPSIPNSSSEQSSSHDILDTKEVGPQTAQNATTIPVVAVGDSILLDISGEIQRIFPKMYVDGLVGRHAADGASTLQNIPSPVLDGAQAFLINLGVNGAIAPADVANVMQIANGRPVYWVNVRVPRSWQDSDNAELMMAAKKYSNLHVIDWFSASIGHPEYFVSDNVHLTTVGIIAYCNLVTNDIASHPVAK